jgi:hypothetical protein
MGDFQDDILVPEEMAAIHAALRRRYGWFEHAGRFDRYRSYQTNGLQPRDPYRDDDGPKVETTTNETARRVVCLRPIDSFQSEPKRGDRQFLMAVRSSELPPRIGIDLSHASATDTAADQRRLHPTWSNASIFIDLAHRLGSFVSYDLIKPSVIRVFAEGSSRYEPDTWPLLVDADERIVVTSGP